MKIIEKHHIDRHNESGVIILFPQDTNILLVNDFKYIAFSSTESVGYKFLKNEPLIYGNSFSFEGKQETFYVSNTSRNEIRLQYSCIHY